MIKLLVPTIKFELEFTDCLVADPGFPRGGGANPQGGAPGYDFIKISRKLHEIKENSAGGGARPLHPP